MYAGGESRPNGGGGGGGGDALRRRRQPGASTSPGAATASSSSSSSSGRGAEEDEGEAHGRGQQRQARRKKQQGRREAVARAIRGGLPSCWGGGVSVVQEAGASGWRRVGRSWSRRERAPAADRDAAAGSDGSSPGAGAGTATAATPWCCVCPGGDCSLEANPSANGKEDPGVRSLLENNDFFSADCNPHADVLPAGAGADTTASYESS